MGASLRAFVRHLFVYALYLSGALARAKKRVRSRGGALVLTLHRVLPDQERSKTLSPPGMLLREQTFASLVSYLSTEHRIVSLGEGQKVATTNQRIPVAITFDDGWADNASYAYPILRRHAAPATIFVCSEKMGQKLPFWPEKITALFRASRSSRVHKQFSDVVAECAALPGETSVLQVIDAIKRLPPEQRDRLLGRLEQMPFARDLDNSDHTDSTMTWETARQLSKSGIVFGSHTAHHEILTCLPVEFARRELTQSRERVSAELGEPCFALAYPNGNWSPEVRDIAASAGYQMAFANTPGFWSKQADPYTIPRINLWEGAVTGISGSFSRACFDYVVFWKTLRETQASTPNPAR